MPSSSRPRDAVAATRSRKAKIDALATLLTECAPDEIATVVCLLTGEPRQGRIGVGWATLCRTRRGRRPAPPTTPTVTVAELDDALDRIAATTGPGSAGGPPGDPRRPLRARRPRPRPTSSCACSPASSARARCRADGRRDRARAAEVPADAVRRAAMLGGDLADTARRALAGGAAALAEVRLEVLRPVQPMLAASAATVAEALAATGPASVEWKLDGARIQVHRAGDDVRVFTRNLNDVTARLPEVVEVARAFAARSFVLDGEAIGLADDALPRRFQDTMSRFGSDDAAAPRADARRVLLRRAAPRRRRPARPAARANAARSSPSSSARGASPAIETDDADARPRRSSPTRSRPATKA